MDWQSIYGGPIPPAYVGVAGVLFALIVVWTLIWKGMALWKAAQKGSKVWFVVLLIVNTLGILEILYLYVFSKKSSTPIEGPRM